MEGDEGPNNEQENVQNPSPGGDGNESSDITGVDESTGTSHQVQNPGGDLNCGLNVMIPRDLKGMGLAHYLFRETLVNYNASVRFRNRHVQDSQPNTGQRILLNPDQMEQIIVFAMNLVELAAPQSPDDQQTKRARSVPF